MFNDPHIRHIQADGRNFLLLTPEIYDIIIVSPSWAVEQASANLLTDEFFSLASERLSKKGILALWVDFFMIPDEVMDTLIRTFSKSFKHTAAWYIDGDNMVLIGTNSKYPYPNEAVTEEINRLKPEYKGTFRVAMTEEDMQFSPGSLLNTDDRPIMEFENAKNSIRGPMEIYKESIGKKDSIWSALRQPQPMELSVF